MEIIKAPQEGSYINTSSTDYVYEFQFCPCTYESATATVSLHRTLKGAYDAMKNHRLKTFQDWRKLPNQYRKDFLDTFAKAWYVEKRKIYE